MIANMSANMPNPFANGGKNYRPVTGSSIFQTKPLGATQVPISNKGMSLLIGRGQSPYISTEQFDENGNLNPIWNAVKVGQSKSSSSSYPRNPDSRSYGGNSPHTVFYEKDEELASLVNEYNDLVKRSKMGSRLSNEEQRRMMDLLRLIRSYQKAPKRA